MPDEPVRITDLSQMAAALTLRSSEIARKTAAENAVFSGGFLGPGIPIMPLEPHGTPARRWDYPPSTNINYRPRSGLTDFAILENLAAWDPIRYCIEERKNRIKAKKWAILPVEEGEGDTEKLGPEIKRLTQYWAKPDGEHTFDLWASLLLEDAFKYDAATIFRWPTMDGTGIAQHVPISGKTISPKIDLTGRIPRAPFPAYQQIIKGVVWNEFTTDQMLYCPRNPRLDSVYGMSEVEWLLIVINIALRRDVYDLSYYTDGNAPAGFIGAPESWTPDQIKTYQTWFDSILAGNLQKRSRVMVVPGGFDFQKWIEREEDKYVKFSEFIVRRACAIFHVSPAAYTAMVNRSTSETYDERQAESGDEMLMQWLSALITNEIQTVQGQPDLQFAFVSERKVDELKTAQSEEIQIRNGKKSIDEIRASDGLDEIGIPPLIMTPSGPIYLRGQNPDYKEKYRKFFEEYDESGKPLNSPGDPGGIFPSIASSGDDPDPAIDLEEEEEDEEEKARRDDLRKWRKVAVRCLKEGKRQKNFESTQIPESVRNEIRERLNASGDSVQKINSIFDSFESGIKKGE